MVVHDLLQHDNRVELYDSVTDAWGLPVAKITIIAHENDRAMGRFLIDRNDEILEAAGAASVQEVYIDRITGNCSHRHGTTRMGNDPEISVLDAGAGATRSTTSSWWTVAHPHRDRHQSHPDDHGECVACRRAHCQRTHTTGQ